MVAASSTYFRDLVLASSDVVVGDPSAVRNAAIPRRFIWPLTSRGMPLAKRLDGGTNIAGRVSLKIKGAAQNYQSGQPLQATRTNTLSAYQLNWCKMACDASWDDEEVVLNGSSAFTDKYVLSKYVEMIDQIMGGAVVDMCVGIENNLSRLPNPNTMEGLNASEPMSIMATHNDHFGTGSAVGVSGNFYNATVAAAFTSVQGINNLSAGKANWMQQIVAYDQTSANPTAGKNIVGAFDEMFELCHWVPPASEALNGMTTAMWEQDSWPRKVCLASLWGKTKLQMVARAQGDRWQDAGANEIAKGPGGPLGTPTFSGMEIIYAPWMDTGTYYLSDYTSATPTNTNELDGQGKGPRFLFVDLVDFGTMFHQDRFFEKKAPQSYETQPFSNTIWWDTYFNNVNKARWTGGIISPGTTSGYWPTRTYTATSVYTS